MTPAQTQPDQHAITRFPMWKGLAASVVAHALAAVVIGAIPRGTPHQHGSAESVFEELPAVVTMDAPEVPPTDERAEAKPPEPKPQPDSIEPPKLTASLPDPPRVLPVKEPEPKTVKLGSPTSTSEAATMTWIGFDEFIEHSGTPSEVDQAQFTMEAPGPRGVVPSEGVAAKPGMPAAPPPAPVARAEPQASPPAPAGAAPIARATDEPLLIAETERRPRLDVLPPSPAADHSDEKVAPGTQAIRPPEAEVGPARDKVEPTAPAPTSLPKEVRGEDKEEIAMPAQGSTPGEPTVTPRDAVPGGGPEAPQFPVSDKAIEPSKDDQAKAGPNTESVKERRPETGLSGEETDGRAKGESADKPTETLDPKQSEPPSESESTPGPRNPDDIPEGLESQGPRPDPNRDNEAPKRASPAEALQKPINSIPSPPVAPGIPVQPQVGTGQEGRGVLSDRESLAAAIKTAIDVDKWGQPLVAKGLRIRTVRPKFSKYTQITARGSPVIRICFDRAGKAREVIVLSSSGVVDVDRPVVDAAYQWTATGKELEQLRENPPETVAIDVRVIR